MKSVLYCYVHKLTYQNKTFMYYFQIEADFSVVFVAPYLMHLSVILWNSPFMHAVNKFTAYFSPSLQCLDMFVEQTKEIIYRK